MRSRISFILILLAISSVEMFAQEKYDKPVNKFGKEEAWRIVNDSPWAKPYQANSAGTARQQGEQGYQGGSNPRSIARDAGLPPVTARLHSGEVYRKAVVRLQQIDNGYDKLGDDKKAEFDKSRQVFLDCKICNEHYVITLTKTNYSKDGVVDEGIFQSLTLADLKGNVTLENDSGEVRELVHFTAPKGPGDSALFYFKRTDASGKHLVTAETKEFRLAFKPDFLERDSRYGKLVPKFYDFKVSKLIVGDKVMF
jgi:hypothetical protein